MVALLLYCFYFILHALNVQCIRYADENSLRVLKLENVTGGYQFEFHKSESYEIPCTVRSPVPLEPHWITWIFQPFKNLRYGEVMDMNNSLDFTSHSSFETLNNERTMGQSTLYWQGSTSGILWCIFNSHYHTRITATESFRLYVEVYVFSKPTAEVALRVLKGAMVYLTCENEGPYRMDSEISWYFRPSTWALNNPSNVDMTHYSSETIHETRYFKKRYSEIGFKVYTSGMLECRTHYREFPSPDSMFFKLEVLTDIPEVCDECGDCEWVTPERVNITTHTEL